MLYLTATRLQYESWQEPVTSAPGLGNPSGCRYWKGFYLIHVRMYRGMPSILLFHIWAENFFFLLIGQLPSQVQTSFPGLSSPGNKVESNADSLLHVTESVCRLAPQLGLKISIKVMRFACYRLALFVIFYISLLSTGSKASQTTNSS